MCTLVIWKHVHPVYPLIAAANRDEYLDRPSTGAEVLCDDPVIVGGRDLTAGGTWLAVNAFGVLAALTNRRGERDPSKRSRGGLVLSAARLPAFARARDALSSIDVAAYNPFALIVADADNASILYGGGERRIEDVADGVHALTNWDLDAQSPRAAASALRAARNFEMDRAAAPEALAAALHALLADHGGGDPREALCVHRNDERYGTRSSSVVLLSRDQAETRLFHADGPPCSTALADVSGMLRHETQGAAPNIPR